MRNSIIKLARHSVIFSAVILSLTACNGFFEKDNTPAPTPLTSYKPEVRPVRLWSASTGAGAGEVYLKMNPAADARSIVTAGSKGTITSVDKYSGRINWRINTGLQLVAGPGIGDGIIVVVSGKGDILALRQDNGQLIWRSTIPGEIMAQPAVGQGIVVVKAVDGYLRGLSVKDGHELWSYRQVEPALILRGSSSPLIRDHFILAGFANGNLTKVGLNDGQLYWQQTVATPEGAFAIERMIDIDADPLVYAHHIYAATYQGKISSLDWTSGRTIWSHDISSYTGMAADNDTVYISDAKGDIWAFGADSGTVLWRQNVLDYRIISQPAVMGNYVVIGDAEGYLHWLNRTDGHIAARESLGSGIYAAPIVENGVLYAQTNTGYLVAYKLA